MMITIFRSILLSFATADLISQNRQIGLYLQTHGSRLATYISAQDELIRHLARNRDYEKLIKLTRKIRRRKRRLFQKNQQ